MNLYLDAFLCDNALALGQCVISKTSFPPCERRSKRPRPDLRHRPAAGHSPLALTPIATHMPTVRGRPFRHGGRTVGSRFPEPRSKAGNPGKPNPEWADSSAQSVPRQVRFSEIVTLSFTHSSAPLLKGSEHSSCRIPTTPQGLRHGLQSLLGHAQLLRATQVIARKTEAMLNSHTKLRAIGLSLVAAIAISAAPPAYDSFEEGLPAHWQPERQGTIGIDTTHAKHGARCLRWDWCSGDNMMVSQRIGNVRRMGGYGGTYSKATFGIWLYMEKPVEGQLRLEFRAKGKPTGWFDFPLDFTGWRRAHLKYSFRSEFTGKVSADVDTIAFRAPEAVPSGTTFIDLVVYNGLMDYRQQWLPRKRNASSVRDGGTEASIRQPPTAAEREATRTIWQRLVPTSSGIEGQVVADLERKAAALGITPGGNSPTAVPVVKNPGFYSEFGLEMGSPAKPAKLMLEIARAFHRSDSPPQRERLAALFLAFSDHLHNQGMAADSGFVWNWYGGRDFAEATLLMAGVLRQGDRLVREAAYFNYNWKADTIFQTATRTSMDDFHIDTRYRLYGALMQASPEGKVRWLRAFSRHLSEKILLEKGDGFKPDGSAFHHGFHYFAYANYSLNSLTHIVSLLGNTPFAISAEAYSRLKRVLLAMRFYCNQNDLPLPLCGRHPHTQAFSAGKLLAIAQASGQGLDRDLIAAYLRFHPEQRDEKRFVDADLRPEPSPEGNLALSYAGLMAHRRDHWLAVVKGYSSYVTHGETYANNNRFGRYLSNGYLDILASGTPVTRRSSGCVEAGWDWNRLDGTTVIYLPPEKLVAPSKGTEMLRSDQTFVGGLSHRKRNGIFVMRIHGAKHHNPSFRAEKTYFLFDNRIICLGTGIVNDDTEHATHTNLFQKHLGEQEAPQGIVVDGQAAHQVPMKRTLDPERAHALLDTQGTGYIIPTGQLVNVARKNQKFREQHDKKELEGLFATAWIDHGKAPSAATYEYAVLVNTSPTRLAALAEAMESSDTAFYQVLQRDSVAHIVWDEDSRSLGCVFLEPVPIPPRKTEITGRVRRWWPPKATDSPLVSPLTQPIIAVERPCLAMIQQGPGHSAILSIADPDLNMIDGLSQPRELTVTLAGEWTSASPNPSTRVRVDDNAPVTHITVVCHQGRTVEMTLRKAR